ncbi:MAG TPA: metallophosphoesterase, partial [Solirubrobacteraceae bacterium]
EGHTHMSELQRLDKLTMLNAGSVGGGGTGNLADTSSKIGLARMTYDTKPWFAALAADLIQIDPANGDAQAQRFRLDKAVEATR